MVSVETELAEVTVSVLVDGLRQLCPQGKTLHGVGDECVSEHVGDEVEIFWFDVGGSPEIVVSQLRGFPGRLNVGTLNRDVEQNTRRYDGPQGPVRGESGARGSGGD